MILERFRRRAAPNSNADSPGAPKGRKGVAAQAQGSGRSPESRAANVLTFEETFDLPRDEVFRLLRDHLEEIGPYIPEISSVTCSQRIEDGPRTSLVNEWRADAATIPLVARPFLPRKLLTWTDRNAWDASDFTCAWTFDAPGPFEAAVDCRGVNRYEELPDGRCRLVSEGRLTIDLAHVPGIPRVFHRASRDVEAFLAQLVSPNLSRIADGLQRYLRAR